MRVRSKTSIIGIAVAATILTACSAPQSSADNDVITVVAATNVYGDIASRIGGEHVEVTSIIDDPSQDPHSFEADARVQLALSKADIVIENGGGYDDFIDVLLSSIDVPGQVVLSAVASSPLNPEGAEDDHEEEDHEDGDHDHGAFNEHVWYHFPTMTALATEIEHALVALDPANRELYESNANAFRSELDGLTDRASELRVDHSGTGVAITEPVALHLLEAIGLSNVTPAAFSEAIEGGSEVSAADLNNTLGLIASGAASVLVYNDQTTSPETEQLLAAAAKAGVPSVSVSELLPDGSDYASWMGGILDSLEEALTGA